MFFIYFLFSIKTFTLAPSNHIFKNISLVSNQETPLSLEEKESFIKDIKFGNQENVIQKLKENSSYLNIQDEVTGYPLIHLAIIHQRDQLIQFLCKEMKVDIDQKDSLGRTPLMTAIKETPSFVSFLIKQGADLYIQDNQGQDSYYYAHLHSFDLNQIGYNQTVYNQTLETLLKLIDTKSLQKVKQFVEKHPDYVNRVSSQGVTPLCHAILCQSLDIAEFLLKEGAQTDKANNQKETPLAVAVTQNLYEESKWLLERGANIESKDVNGRTILFRALFGENHREEVRFQEFFQPHHFNKDLIDLLDQHHVNFNARGPQNKSSLMWLLLKSDIIESKQNGLSKEFLNLLLDKGALVDLPNEKGEYESILAFNIEQRWAQQAGIRPELNKIILQKGRARLETKYNGKTPLMMAVEYGEYQFAELLLEENADINTTNPEGHTPLSYAIMRGNNSLISTLLKFIENNHVQSEEENYLGDSFHELVRNGKEERINDQLQYKKGIFKLKDTQGNPIWQTALENNQLTIFQTLIEKGTDIEQTNTEGETALMRFVKKGQIETVKMLLEKGASLYAKSKEGKSILDIANEQRKKGIIDLIKKAILKENEIKIKKEKMTKKNQVFRQLIEEGDLNKIKEAIEKDQEEEKDTNFQYLNTEDENGNSPLHIAILNQKEKIFHLLLQYKLNPNKKNKEGLTPLSLMITIPTFITIEKVDKLIQKGADINVKIDGQLIHKKLKDHPLDPIEKSGTYFYEDLGLLGYIYAKEIRNKAYSLDLVFFIFNQMDINKMTRFEMNMMAFYFLEALQKRYNPDYKVSDKNDTLTVEEYLNHSKNFLKVISKDGETILMNVLKYCKDSPQAEKEMTFFINQGASLETKGRDLYEGQTLLFWALQNENFQAVNWLMSHEVQCDEMDKSFHTPFWYLLGLNTSSERTQLIKRFLLEKDIDINKEGQKYLLRTLTHEDYETAILLVQRGININTTNRNGKTALMRIIEKTREETRDQEIKLVHLILQKEDITAIQNNNEETALHLAINNNDVEMAQIILEHSCSSLHIKNKNGKTPLEESQLRTSSLMFKTLLHHVTENKKEVYQSLLHHSARNGYTQAFLALLEIYQPSDKELLEILKVSPFEIGLIIISLLPMNKKLPNITKKGILYDIIKNLNNQKGDDRILFLFTVPISPDTAIQKHFFSSLIKNYLKNKKTTESPHQSLLSLLTKGLSEEFISKNSSSWNDFKREISYNARLQPHYNFPEDIQLELLLRFLSIFEAQEREELLGQLIQINKNLHENLQQKLQPKVDFVPPDRITGEESFISLEHGISYTNQKRLIGMLSSMSLPFKINQKIKEKAKIKEDEKAIWINDDPIYPQLNPKNTNIPEVFQECLKKDTPQAFKKYIQENFDVFKTEFTENSIFYFTTMTVKDYFLDSIKEKETFIKLIEVIISVYSKDSSIISTILNYINVFQTHQKTFVFQWIFETHPSLIAPSNYPLMMVSSTMEKKWKEKILNHIKQNLEVFKKEFIANPQIYMVENSDFLTDFISLCLEDKKDDTIFTSILDNMELITGNLSLIIKEIIIHEYHLIKPQHYLKVIKVYLSQNTQWPKEIDDIIHKHFKDHKLSSEIHSIEEKVFYLSLETGHGNRLQNTLLSFNQYCFVLSCWVRHNQGTFPQMKNFFSHKEHKHLKYLQTYTEKLSQEQGNSIFWKELETLQLIDTKSLPRNEDGDLTDESREELKKIISKQKIKGCEQLSVDLYKKWIYPWAMIFYTQSLELTPSFKYEQPTYAKQEVGDYSQETPGWELLAWINLNHPELSEVFLHSFQPLWDRSNHPLLKKLKNCSAFLFVEIQRNEKLQRQLVDLLKDFQKNKGLNEKKLNSFLDKNVEESDLYLPLEFLAWVGYNQPESYEKYKSFFKNNLDNEVYKNFLMNEALLVWQISDKEKSRSQILEILKADQLQFFSDKEKGKMWSDLEKLLKSEWNLQYNSSEYEKWNNNKIENGRKLSTGIVVLYYIKNSEGASTTEYNRFQAWSHRLTNRAIPHSKVIVGKEEEWYQHTENLLHVMGKHITFEKENFRKKNLEFLPHMVSELDHCASQTQNFSMQVKTLFKNEPNHFDDLKEAFFHATMNCRSDLIHKAGIEGAPNLRESVHAVTLALKISLENNWNIPEASLEDLTEGEDVYSPHTESIIKSFFEKKYNFSEVFFEFIFKKSCPPHFFGIGEKNTVPPYAPALMKSKDIDFWDENYLFIKPDSILETLLSSHLIDSKNKSVSSFSTLNSKQKSHTTKRHFFNDWVEEKRVRMPQLTRKLKRSA